MSCEAWEALLSAFYDQELEGEAQHRVERHLETCSSCREVLEAFRGISASMASFVEPDPGFVARFRLAVERERAAGARAWQQLGLRLLPLAAAAVLATGLGLWWSSRAVKPALAELERMELGGQLMGQEEIPQDPVVQIVVGSFPEMESR